MDQPFDEVIDLSDSFTLADHHALTNVVIELDTDESGFEIDDDSIVDLVQTPSPVTSRSVTALRAVPSSTGLPVRRTQQPHWISRIFEIEVNKIKEANEVISSEKQTKFGECPICLDPLGKNPLASTICGHVYCVKCIERYLMFDKRCPTCRRILKGRSSYHPLYLNK